MAIEIFSPKCRKSGKEGKEHPVSIYSFFVLINL
jgi:hypothetical protein